MIEHLNCFWHFTLPSSVPLLQPTGRNWCCHRSTHSKCTGAAFWVPCVELSQSSCHLSDTQWWESKDRRCEMTNDIIYMICCTWNLKEDNPHINWCRHRGTGGKKSAWFPFGILVCQVRISMSFPFVPHLLSSDVLPLEGLNCWEAFLRRCMISLYVLTYA